MRRVRRVTLLLAVLVGAVTLLACGDDDEVDTGGSDTGGSESTTTDGASDTTTAPSGSVDLTIDISDGSATAHTATLRCTGDDPAGTGHLADADAARAACELVTGNEAARTRLVEGEPTDRMCTQIYGGPEVATVEGTIDGQPVRTTVRRNDGCGIADWELLTPLLGAPTS